MISALEEKDPKSVFLNLSLIGNFMERVMKKIQRAFLWILPVIYSSSVFANGYIASPYPMRQYPNLGPLNNGQVVQSGQQVTSSQQSVNPEQSVLKEQIQSNKQEIIILKTDIREIEADIRDLDRRSDPLANGCDCRASAGACSASVFSKLGLNPQSTNACRELWESDKTMNSLPLECRRVVRICKRVDKQISKYETEERLRELNEENRELERDLRRIRPTRSSQEITRHEQCIECTQRYKPSFGEVMLGLTPAITTLGLGAMGMHMYNRSIDAYYGAYQSGLNAYSNQVGNMYDHYTTLGVPAPFVGNYPAPAFFGGQSMGLAGWLGSPLGMSGMFNPFMNAGFNTGINPMFTNGFAPFGVQAQFGLGLGLGNGFQNGFFNPYAMTNGFSPFGLGMMNAFNPLGMGMGLAQMPLNMGFNSLSSPWMGNGLNTGFGFNPWLNTGFNNGFGLNNGMWNNPWGNWGLGMQNPWMNNQFGLLTAQNNLNAASYRFNQVMQQSSPWGAWGGFNGVPFGFGSGFGTQLGIGLQFGVQGGLNFGGNGYFGP